MAVKKLEKKTSFAYFDKAPESLSGKAAEKFEAGFYVVEGADDDGHETNPTLGDKLAFTEEDPNWPVYAHSLKSEK